MKKKPAQPPNFQETLQSLHLCVCVCSFSLCIVKFVDENLWLNLLEIYVCAPCILVAKHLFLFVLVGLLIMWDTKYPLMNFVLCILGLYFLTSMVLHRTLLCKFFF